MSQTVEETIKIVGTSKYSLRIEGKEKPYNISKFLQQDGVSAGQFNPGQVIRAKVWTSDKGAKYINSFELVSTSIPESPVTKTSPTNGESPVRPPSKKREESTNPKNEYWERKDLNITCQAIWKSTIESPAIATAIIGGGIKPEEVASKIADVAGQLTDRFLDYVSSKQGV